MPLSPRPISDLIRLFDVEHLLASVPVMSGFHLDNPDDKSCPCPAGVLPYVVADGVGWVLVRGNRTASAPEPRLGGFQIPACYLAIGNPGLVLRQNTIIRAAVNKVLTC